MRISSTRFRDGDYLPLDHVLSADYGFGCGGGNRSPHLRWDDVPPNWSCPECGARKEDFELIEL
jgi:phosphatidylethanolamine-binding protein (PEBP) family uncharacterized protein